jgi:ribose transport system ATP-binding protein
MKDCKVLLFDEPTRGIDIQTRQAIYELLYGLAARGKAVVVVSSEIRELTTICDRIAVLSNGRLAEVFERSEWSAEKIMAASFSAYTDHVAA